MTPRIPLQIVLFCVLVASSALAADIHVNSEGTGDYPTIQAALYAASSGDVIILADGTYTGSDNRRLEFQRQVTLRSETNFFQCIIDFQGSAGDPQYGFSLTEETGGTIQGITLKNAYWSNGAVAQTRYGHYIFEDCFFVDNHASGRGGVWHGTDGTNINFRHCTFLRNTAGSQGGALSGSTNTSITVQGCTFVLNGAPNGGCIYLDDLAYAEVTDSLLAWGIEGSAVDHYYSDGFDFTCCDIYGNRGGNWTNGATGNGINGNQQVDPLLIDPMAAEPNLWLSQYSPLAEGVSACGQVGAFPSLMIPLVVHGVNAAGTGMYATIEDAVDHVPSGGNIVLEDGVYSGSGSSNITAYGKNLAISSRSAIPEQCQIDMTGETDDEVFTFGNSEGESSLKGILISGFADNYKNMIVLESVNFILENCRFQNNEFSYNNSTLTFFGAGSLTLANCQFSNNSSFSSTAVLQVTDEDDTEGNTLEIHECNFFDNTSTRAGTVMKVDGFDVELDNCTFSDNVCTDDWNNDSTIYIVNSEVDIHNSVFENNYSQNGGALYLGRCTGEISNGVFLNNTSRRNGGALSMFNSDIRVYNSEFQGNESLGNGGAVNVQVGGINSSTRTVRFEQCEFIGNRSVVGGGAIELKADNIGNPFDPPVFFNLNVDLTQCTFHRNETLSMNHLDAAQINGQEEFLLSNADLDLDINYCLITGGIGSSGINLENVTSATLLSTNIHGNEAGSWTGSIADQLDHDGNISIYPYYCAAGENDLRVNEISACLPDNNEYNTQIGSNGVGCFGLTDVGDDGEMPAVTGITGNYPNPFNPRTTVNYVLSSESLVSLRIHDLAGRVVRTLVSNQMEAAGPQQKVWNGLDDQHRVLSAGVYFARLKAGAVDTTHKMILLK